MKHTTWRTSSYTGENNDCVELAIGDERTGVRDSKDRTGPELWFSSRAAASFVSAVKAGQFDR